MGILGIPQQTELQLQSSLPLTSCTWGRVQKILLSKDKSIDQLFVEMKALSGIILVAKQI